MSSLKNNTWLKKLGEATEWNFLWGVKTSSFQSRWCNFVDKLNAIKIPARVILLIQNVWCVAYKQHVNVFDKKACV